ncbi:MAG: dihydroorotate dehydrogenase electron transfer subunit [Eggerthellaceae bacterium]
MTTGLANERGVISANECVGPHLYLLRATLPRIAETIEPGQFIHMKLPGMEGHILRRPFSVYRALPQSGSVEILYQEVGFGTAHMRELSAGQAFEAIGPIGRGWQVPAGAARILLVAGGVGAAPLFMLAQQQREAGVAVDVVLGAQTEAALVTRESYDALCGSTLQCATDDGSFGHAGFCTGLVEDNIGEHLYDYLACCGPEPLMRIVAQRALDDGIFAQVSLERRMACGVGACLSCVVDTHGGKKRACVDGPIFDAAEVVW